MGEVKQERAPGHGATLGAVDADDVKRARILIVDDHEPNVLLLERFLDADDFTNVVSTTDSSQVVSLCAELQPDLILLDLLMPSPDGFEVMAMLRPWTHGSTRLPVLVLTGDTSPDTKRRALRAGAKDFLSKPFDPAEVTLRIENLLETRLLQLELREQNRALEQRVRERTRDLEEARLEIVDRLALVAEFRDDATGEHTQRVGRTAALLARALGLPDDEVEVIRRAAPLHDVGKVGMSDAVLLKRGALTDAEREMMKLHTTIGGEMLARSRSRLLQAAQEIALTHHERWDGSGYPAGLKGDAIPLAGRLVALADTFDAITHARPYAEPMSVDRAVAEIRRLSGRQFDPQVVDAFASLPHEALARGDRAVLGLVA